MELRNPFKNGRILGVGVSAAEYMQQEFKRGEREFVMSRSELCEFNVCPDRWIRGHKGGDDTKSTEWGTLIDCMVLTPERFQSEFVIEPATYEAEVMQCPKCKSVTESQACKKCKCDRVKTTVTKPWSNNATYCDEWTAKQSRRIVKAKTVQDAEAAVSRLKANDEIAEFISVSQKQVYAIAEYHDAATGLVIPVKCCADLVPNSKHKLYGKGLADFKTARTADPREWSKAVFDHNYHVQAAVVNDIYIAATNEDRCEFRHVIQENFAPYQPAKRILASEFVNLGRATYLDALRRYCRCLKDGNWPDYDTESREQISGWQFTQPLPYMVAA